MNTKKLLASDLDGTLIFHKRISRDTIDAIHAWQDAGHLAVCATGKSIAATQHALRESNLEFDYYVLYTGAVVTNASFEILRSITLPSLLVMELVQAISQEDSVGIFATTLDTNDVRLASTLPADLTTDMVQYFDPMDISEIPHHTFVGIPIWVDTRSSVQGVAQKKDAEEAITRLHSWITSEYKGRIDCHRNQNFLDIVPPACSKASGLTWLLRYLQETTGSTFETYSLGDSWNDIDMHQWADYSASFPHSPKEIQNLTDAVTPTAAEYIYQLLSS